MAEAGVVRRIVIPFVLLGLTALGLLNTFGDASDVQRLAAETACGGEMCPVQMREYQRSPFSHAYVYAVGSGKDSSRVDVKCTRAYIFLGEYRCEKKK